MGSGSSRRRGAAAEKREPLQTVRAEAAGGAGAARDAGRGGEAAAGGSGRRPEQAALSTSSSPSPENNVDHQCPARNSKQLLAQGPVSYDYSEEELMASIEREYGS